MASPSMSLKHQQILRRNSKYLRTELEAVRVCYELLSNEIFDQEHVNEVKAEKTPQKRADALLEILPKRGNQAFEEFLKGLDNVQPHLATFLRQEERKADAQPDENEDSSPITPPPHISDHVDSYNPRPQENANNHSNGVQESFEEPDLPIPLQPPLLRTELPTISLQEGPQLLMSELPTVPSGYVQSGVTTPSLSDQGSFQPSSGSEQEDLSDTESNMVQASRTEELEGATSYSATDYSTEDGCAIDEGDGPFTNLFKKKKQKGSDHVDKALLPNYQFDKNPPNSSIYGTGVDERTIYKMNTNVRGIALIINNKDFTVSPLKYYPRKGTDIDAFALQKLFTDLKYKVILEHQKTVNQIRDLLWQHTKNTDHSQYSSFVFIVLSHGEEGKVYGTDGMVDIKELAILARDTDSLVGKPKLFFIQACQGTEFMKGRDVIDGAAGRNLLFAMPEQPPEDKLIQLPIEADFLYAHSTVPGYYSWRNMDKGSWFMQEVVKIFYQHAKHMDIVRMLTRVNASMATRKSDANQTMQISTIVSHLRKELYFFPGEMRVTDPIPHRQEMSNPGSASQDCVDNIEPDSPRREISQENREVASQSSYWRCNIM